MNIPWLLFLSILGLVNAKFDCVSLSGRFKCIKGYGEQRNTKIEVLDKDTITSEVMGITYAQKDGTFAIFSCGADPDILGENLPDPYLRVTHTCGIVEEKSFNLGFREVFAPHTLDFGVMILDDGLPIGEEYYLMQQTTEETYEISSNFDDLEFGIKNDGALYRQAKSVSSIAEKSPSIAATICGVLKKCCVEFDDIPFSPLPNHVVAYDEFDQKIFMRAEVKIENLNKEADSNERSMEAFKVNSVKGDIPYKFIPCIIGGFDSPLNIFPLNPAVDMNAFEAAITAVHNHVNGGEDNIARLMYVMDYTYENANCYKERPFKIFYHFKLYKNGQFTGEEIEGIVINLLPQKK